MTPKTINTMHQSVACDVCGRTLLRGEQADVYLAGGRRQHVCELCTARAAHEGWIREGAGDRFDTRRAGTDSRRSLLGRLRARRARAAQEVDLPILDDRGEEDLDPPAPLELDAAFDAIGAPLGGGAGAEVELPPPAPAAPAGASVVQQPRHVRAVPTNAELKMARALEVFNGTEHPRTVAGVARSLGAPMVAVRASADHASVVHVIVAWELSWYRYAVDLSDEHQPVQVLDRGYELHELAPAERDENAVADETGMLRLA